MTHTDLHLSISVLEVLKDNQIELFSRMTSGFETELHFDFILRKMIEPSYPAKKAITEELMVGLISKFNHHLSIRQVCLTLNQFYWFQNHHQLVDICLHYFPRSHMVIISIIISFDDLPGLLANIIDRAINEGCFDVEIFRTSLYNREHPVWDYVLFNTSTWSLFPMLSLQRVSTLPGVLILLERLYDQGLFTPTLVEQSFFSLRPERIIVVVEFAIKVGIGRNVDFSTLVVGRYSNLSMFLHLLVKCSWFQGYDINDQMVNMFLNHHSVYVQKSREIYDMLERQSFWRLKCHVLLTSIADKYLFKLARRYDQVQFIDYSNLIKIYSSNAYHSTNNAYVYHIIKNAIRDRNLTELNFNSTISFLNRYSYERFSHEISPPDFKLFELLIRHDLDRQINYIGVLLHVNPVPQQKLLALLHQHQRLTKILENNHYNFPPLSDITRIINLILPIFPDFKFDYNLLNSDYGLRCCSIQDILQFGKFTDPTEYFLQLEPQGLLDRLSQYQDGKSINWMRLYRDKKHQFDEDQHKRFIFLAKWHNVPLHELPPNLSTRQLMFWDPTKGKFKYPKREQKKVVHRPPFKERLKEFGRIRR
jgi:hypothetical protein